MRAAAPATGPPGSTAVTDQPPSTASSCPVMRRSLVGQQEERGPGHVDRVEEATGERLLAACEVDRGWIRRGARGHRRSTSGPGARPLTRIPRGA